MMSPILSDPLPSFPTVTELLENVAVITGAPLTVLLAGLVALTILIRDWRFALLALTGHYLVMLFPLSLHTSTEWALLRVTSGCLAAIMLFMSARRVTWGAPLAPPYSSGQRGNPPFPQPASGFLVRAITVGMAALAFSALRPALPLPDLPPGIISITIWLGLMGVVGLALGEDPFHATLALLLWLSGAGLLLVTALQGPAIIGAIGVLELLIGLAGSYLVITYGAARWPVDVREQRPTAPPEVPLTPLPRQRRRWLPHLPAPQPGLAGLRARLTSFARGGTAQVQHAIARLFHRSRVLPVDRSTHLREREH